MGIEGDSRERTRFSIPFRRDRYMTRMKLISSDRCRRITTFCVAFIALVSTVFTVFQIRYERPPLVFRTSSIKSKSVCTGYSPLYKDAEKTHQYYLERGGIQSSDLAASKEHCEKHGQCIQIKLYNMNLYVGNVSENPHCYETRGEALLMNLNMAVEQARMEGDVLQNIDVYLLCHDKPEGGTHGMWYISKSVDNANAHPPQDNFFLMPDFNFYSWPEAFNEPWSRAHTHIAEAGKEIVFEEKDRRMFWRGAAWTSPDRTVLMEVTRNHTDVADIIDITWGKGNDPAPGTFVSGAEMCAWKYIIYTEGISYSGRLKYNMLCSSVIIGPKPHWLEFWSHLIVPGFNYVAVNRDWSDLLSTHATFEETPDATAEIATNARRTMEYLDTRGVSCYLRELIRRYADVCHWDVEEPDMGPVRERRRVGVDWMAIEDYFLATLRKSG